MHSSPELIGAAAPSESASTREEERAFLQRRVALFGLLGAAIGGGFWLFRLPLALGSGELGDGSFWLHLVAWLFLAAVWVATRSGSRSVFFSRAVENIGFVGSSVAYIGMANFVPLINRPDQLVVLALTYAIVARAVWVPSSAKRTAVLAAIVGVPLLLIIFLRLDGATAVEFEPFHEAGSQRKMAIIGTIFTSAWWISTSVLATLITKTLFGLRKQARNVRRLGQYHLEEKLGAGGMGLVYRASHAMLRRPTAVKILPPAKLGERSVERFEREVRQTARLKHRNTVTIYDYGRTPDGLFYYAMELLEGADLARIVSACGPMPESRATRILIDASGSLAEAHAMGLIHRDIKPSNILLCEQGGEADVTKVVDFGLAKEIKSEGAQKSLSSADTLTGTPHYMAPETIRTADGADARSDIYALGAVGYFLVTGTPVFDGNLLEVCGHHLFTEPESPSKRIDGEVDSELERVLLRCLAKEPEERPQTALELRHLLISCAIASAWTPEDAERWWQEHREEIAETSDEDAKLSDKTLAVDLARRS